MPDRRAILAGVGGSMLLPKASARVTPLTIDLGEAGGAPGGFDNCDAMKTAIARLRDSGGGTLRIPDAEFFLSAEQLTNAGLVLGPGIAIEGAGPRSALRVVGRRAANLFRVINASNVTISGLRLSGNNVQGGWGDGACLLVILNQDARGDVTAVRLDNCVLENFATARWVSFLHLGGTSHRMTGCGTRGNSYRALRGNEFSPALIGATSVFVEANGYRGPIRGFSIEDQDFDARWIKGAVSIYGDVENFQVSARSIRDAGRGEGRPDTGRYGVTVYRSDGGTPRRGRLSIGSIERPFSCGVYLAGANDVAVTVGSITGQSDTADTTLPKGAIVSNGSRNLVIRAASIADCVIGIQLAAPNELRGRASVDAGITIDARIERCSLAGIVVRSNPAYADWGGIRVKGTIRGARFGLLFQTSRASAITDFQADGLSIDATDFAVHLGFVNGGRLDRLSFRNGRYAAARGAFVANDGSAIGAVSLSDITLETNSNAPALLAVRLRNLKFSNVAILSANPANAVKMTGGSTDHTGLRIQKKP